MIPCCDSVFVFAFLYPLKGSDMAVFLYLIMSLVDIRDDMRVHAKQS